MFASPLPQERFAAPALARYQHERGLCASIVLSGAATLASSTSRSLSDCFRQCPVNGGIKETLHLYALWKPSCHAFLFLQAGRAPLPVERKSLVSLFWNRYATHAKPLGSKEGSCWGTREYRRCTRHAESHCLLPELDSGTLRL